MTGSVVGASTRSASTVTAKVWKPDRSCSTGHHRHAVLAGLEGANVHGGSIGTDQPQDVQLIRVQGADVGDHERGTGAGGVDHVAAAGGSVDRMRRLAGGDGIRHCPQRLLLLVEL